MLNVSYLKKNLKKKLRRNLGQFRGVWLCKKHIHNYFSYSSLRITQLLMLELSSFQGNILVTDPMRPDENMLLSGESGTKWTVIIGWRNPSSMVAHNVKYPPRIVFYKLFCKCSAKIINEVPKTLPADLANYFIYSGGNLHSCFP